MFPNIAFSNIGEFDLDEQLNVKSVHNKEKLKQALNFRFNVKVFKTQFSLIDELDGANIDL